MHRTLDVSPLLPRCNDMQLRGLAPATQQSYLRYVEQLTVFSGKSPDLATDEDFRQFFLALHKQARLLPLDRDRCHRRL